ncbi:hypothetical protein EK21DRAFT_104469 [Setomelanomma holmii]|uniref:Uncharacterized protein n=1 Tax=Setomelanomma holmii TaxID=210430 RepID=A0A9P4GZ50_9PLEO|nr:hypothetical protein EK21DRAFT_104469 [Setomelanomma holmii]
MASGVEVAGLVLCSISLILAGLQFYAEGINVTKRYAKYREEFSSLVVELRAENTLYINSINMLLIGVVERGEMAVFLADPQEARWQDPKFDRKLKKRLGTTFDSYFETVEHLMGTTERLKERLKLDPTGKPQFTDVNKFKEHYKRLKFSLNKSQANQPLYRMTVQTSHLAVHQASSTRCQQAVPNYRIIEDRAESFHSAISKGWKCPCQTDHSISLRLESRTEEDRSDDEDGEDPMRDPFRIILQYDQRHSPDPSQEKPWTWEGADVRVKYDPQGTPSIANCAMNATKGVKFAKKAIPKAVQAALDAQPNLQPIHDLCSAISTLQKPQPDVCFSLLANEIAKQKYGVLLITPSKHLPSDIGSWSISSLRILLDLITEFQTADRLAEALLSEAGARYSNAVWRCIRCDFDQQASSLEDARFVKAVYQGVVAQLQENYEYLFQN